MASSYKILLLDDDQELLDMYREILGQLGSKPEVHTVSSGARAISLLETQPFHLMITDLNMPKMDGLQVLSIVRRKYPHLRIVVLTSVMDEQFRSRAYAMGVDLFWQKPGTMEEIKLFIECVESLLTRNGEQEGFRGVQSKSLMDLIQIECLSSSNSVLHITNGALDGKIWIQNGNVIDAIASDFRGADAFKEILGWKTGNFEILPYDEGHPQTIFESYQGLMLEAAQEIDEGRGEVVVESADSEGEEQPLTVVQRLSRTPGLEFLLAVPLNGRGAVDAWATENPGQMADFARELWKDFVALGDSLQAGQMEIVEGRGAHGTMTLAGTNDACLCAGWNRGVDHLAAREKHKELMTKWLS